MCEHRARGGATDLQAQTTTIHTLHSHVHTSSARAAQRHRVCNICMCAAHTRLGAAFRTINVKYRSVPFQCARDNSLLFVRARIINQFIKRCACARAHAPNAQRQRRRSIKCSCTRTAQDIAHVSEHTEPLFQCPQTLNHRARRNANAIRQRRKVESIGALAASRFQCDRTTLRSQHISMHRHTHILDQRTHLTP